MEREARGKGSTAPAGHGRLLVPRSQVVDCESRLPVRLRTTITFSNTCNEPFDRILDFGELHGAIDPLRRVVLSRQIMNSVKGRRPNR